MIKKLCKTLLIYKSCLKQTFSTCTFFSIFSKNMQKYKCCCSLKTASIIIGFFFMVSCTVIVITAVLGLAVSDSPVRDAFNPEGKTTVTKTEYIITLVVALIIMANSGCLVYGALTERKKFVAPWLFTMGMLITLLLCGIIYTSISTHSSACLLAVLIAGQWMSQLKKNIFVQKCFCYRRIHLLLVLCVRLLSHNGEDVWDLLNLVYRILIMFY